MIVHDTIMMIIIPFDGHVDIANNNNDDDNEIWHKTL